MNDKKLSIFESPFMIVAAAVSIDNRRNVGATNVKRYSHVTAMPRSIVEPGGFKRFSLQKRFWSLEILLLDSLNYTIIDSPK